MEVEEAEASRVFRALSPAMRQQVQGLQSIIDPSMTAIPVFTARKAVCTVEALRTLGKIELPEAFTSNRALDGDSAWIRGKRFLVVEDIASSGTTLRKTISHLRRAGAESVEWFALSAESKQTDLERELQAPGRGPFSQARSADSLIHTQSLIAAFTAAGQPYNVDWPTYRLSQLPSEMAMEASGWSVSRSQRTGAGSPFNLEVTAHVHHFVKGLRIPWYRQIKPQLQLAKIRVYPLTAEAGEYVAIPIVAMGKLDRQQLLAHVRSLEAATGTKELSSMSPGEQYRLMQFMLSQALLEIARESLGCECEPLLDANSIKYLFAPPRVDSARRSVEAMTTYMRDAVRGTHNGARGSFGVRNASTAFADDHDRRLAADAADSALTHLLLTRYRATPEYELREQRKATKDAGELFILQRRLTELDRSAGAGSLSAAEMRQHLKSALPVRSGTNGLLRHFVSDFLDRGIDSGEIVPETFDDGVTTERRFRAGEVLEFHSDNRALVERMIRVFAAESDRVTLSKDLVQKLIIGFFRFLLLKEAVHDLGPSGGSTSMDTIQFRYHLRGIVASDPSEDFVAGTGVPSSLKILVEDGVLLPSAKGYDLPERPAMAPSPRLVSDARVFGSTMAKLLALRSTHKGKDVLTLNLEEFNAFSTLVTPDDRVLAIGADLSIANNFLKRDDDPTADLQLHLAEASHQALFKLGWCHQEASKTRLAAADRRFLADPMNEISDNWTSVSAAFRPQDASTAHRNALSKLAMSAVQLHIYVCCRRYLSRPGNDRQTRLKSDLENPEFQYLLNKRENWRPRSESSVGKLLECLESRIADETAPEEEILCLVSAAREQVVFDCEVALSDCRRINLIASGRPPTEIANFSLIFGSTAYRALGELASSNRASQRELIMIGGERRLLPGLCAVSVVSGRSSLEDRAATAKALRNTDGVEKVLSFVGLPVGLRLEILGGDVAPPAELVNVCASFENNQTAFLCLSKHSSLVEKLRSELRDYSERTIRTVTRSWTVFSAPSEFNSDSSGDHRRPRQDTNLAIPQEVNMSINVNVHNGDNNNHGVAANIGAGTSISGSFQQLNGGDINLAQELAALAFALRSAKDPESLEEAVIVDQISESLASGDDAAANGHSRRLGQRTRRMARDLSLNVAAAWVAHQTGVA